MSLAGARATTRSATREQKSGSTCRQYSVPLESRASDHSFRPANFHQGARRKESSPV